jgi:sulfur carrier protein
MDIFINNEKTEVDQGQTLRILLTDLKIVNPKGIAIAINNNVIPKAVWDNHSLQEQDRISIIRATQGG